MNGATLSIEFELSGYRATLALDGENGTDLLCKAPAVVKALEGLGASPTAQALASKGNGAAEPETKICPLHHAPMKRRTGKGGDVWYSHKAVDPDTGAEYWCRGKARAGR
jgi:hypothetical protein